MRNLTLLLLGFLLFTNHLSGQTLKQFNELVSKKDTIGQKTLLETWEASNTNDPDLYVAYLNYYYLRSMKEVISINKTPKGKNAIQILDTLTKEPVGYMYSEMFYDPEIIANGIKYIDLGILKFPARLDMRFGKVYILGKMGNYDSFTQEIINALDYSNLIDNNWRWIDDKPLDDSKNYMLRTIQSYQNQLYNTGNDSLLNNMAKIAKTVLKYYPDHIESLSNLSVVYLLLKNYESALEILLKAEKIDPKDYIVLGNIAQAYKLKGDKQNAIKYYELVLNYGDDESKQFARDQIKELKQKK